LRPTGHYVLLVWIRWGSRAVIAIYRNGRQRDAIIVLICSKLPVIAMTYSRAIIHLTTVADSALLGMVHRH
jgi:hypothetical protein